MIVPSVPSIAAKSSQDNFLVSSEATRARNGVSLHSTCSPIAASAARAMSTPSTIRPGQRTLPSTGRA